MNYISTHRSPPSRGIQSAQNGDGPEFNLDLFDRD